MLALNWFTVLALGALCAVNGDRLLDAVGLADTFLDPVHGVGSVPLILTGPHVCPRNVTKQVTREVTGKKPIDHITEKKHCPTLGGCPVKKPIFGKKNITASEDVLVYECCKGYKETPSKMCEPDCTECIHGFCTDPEVCTCEPNYGGPTCSHTCGENSGKWGLDCKTDCTCQNNATCDPFNGKCNCSAGWIGGSCDEICQPGKYGKGCAETCQCKNEADCNHITGICSCKPGWIGKNCEEVVQRGKYAVHGPADSLLDPVVGSVPLTLTGPHVCPRNVTKQVTREVTGKKPIHHIPERIHCPTLGGCISKKPIFGKENITASEEVLVYECCEGYKETPSKTCEPDCAECIHGICTEPEVCTCEPNYGGPTCSHTCGENSGKWGVDCKTDCTCKNNATCDPYNGKCNCSAGWIGENCDEVCQQGKYGKGCAETCQCGKNADCNHITGKCTCTPGWIGESCDEVCQQGKYGKGCAETCQCKNDADCNHITGKCACTPGWIGEGCDEVCQQGKYGKGCAETCQCKNDADCNHITGICSCDNCERRDKEGWTTVFWVVVSAVLLGVLVFYIVMNRRRVAILKSKLGWATFVLTPRIDSGESI